MALDIKHPSFKAGMEFGTKIGNRFVTNPDRAIHSAATAHASKEYGRLQDKVNAHQHFKAGAYAAYRKALGEEILLDQEFINEAKHVSHKNLDDKSAAEHMHNFADKYYNSRLKNSPFKDDKDMMKMFKADSDDFHKIANHISTGNYNKAGRVIDNMDTAPREDVPRVIHRYLKSKGANYTWMYEEINEDVHKNYVGVSGPGSQTQRTPGYYGKTLPDTPKPAEQPKSFLQTVMSKLKAPKPTTEEVIDAIYSIGCNDPVNSSIENLLATKISFELQDLIESTGRKIMK